MRSLLIWVAIAAVGFLVYQSQQADRDDQGEIVASGNIDAFKIRIGDCYDDEPSEADVEGDLEIFGVAGVPCADPHDNEVYAVINLDLAEFPGSEEISNLAFEECLGEFDAFVGRDYETSQLDITTLYPTIESWQQMNDREIVCSLFDLDLAKLEGSMRGSGI